jgi:cell division transport system permease protein
MAGVLAIMLFLTVLAAAGGIGAARGAEALRGVLAGRATVQIVTADAATRTALAARVLATLRTSPAVRQAIVVPPAALARLLGPWLGDAATGADLPIPALIDIELAPQPGALAQVRARLAAITPAARVDAHADALAGTGTLLAMLTVLAGAVVVLMSAGSAAVVLLAVRSGLGAHRTTIEVMHGLGATDAQVAQLFQRRIARDAGVGAAAGGVAAWAVILLLGRLAAGTGSQLLDGVALGQGGWIAVVGLPFAFVGFAALVAYVAVVRALGQVA